MWKYKIDWDDSVPANIRDLWIEFRNQLPLLNDVLHVPTQDNPADLISRGQYPKDFLQSKIWKVGPPWLKDDHSMWPKTKLNNNEIPEDQPSKPILLFTLTISNKNKKGQSTTNTDLLERYSHLRTLKHLVAYCLRFIYNSKTKNETERLGGPLLSEEIDTSMNTILKITQNLSFSKEMSALTHGESIDKKSSLLCLNPFLDQGIIRVGGRLENANIPTHQKHPIVLSRNHHVTTIIIREEHLKLKHASTQATLYGVREHYWPIDGRNVTRHIIRKCVKCFRAKPREIEYIMGNLPEKRLSYSRPFLNVGVDYCGPFYIKEKRHRNRKRENAYVLIFICFATKAVHLELVSELTTEAFLGSLKRFFSRRGKANTIHSDNGKNFVGANRELKSLHEFIQTT